MNGRLRAVVPFVVVAALVVGCDVLMIPLRQSAGKYPYDQPLIILQLARGFVTVVAASLTGLFLAPRVGSPLWWRPGDGSRASRWSTVIVVLFSLAVVAYNSVSVLAYAVFYPGQMAALAPWIEQMSPGIAIVGSVRAALYEDTLWRLCLFNVATWGVLRLLRSRRASLTIGAVVPTFFFGFTHAGYLSAFFISLALVYIYRQRGLLPAMIVRFFTDAIPYVLVSAIPYVTRPRAEGPPAPMHRPPTRSGTPRVAAQTSWSCGGHHGDGAVWRAGRGAKRDTPSLTSGGWGGAGRLNRAYCDGG